MLLFKLSQQRVGYNPDTHKGHNPFEPLGKIKTGIEMRCVRAKKALNSLQELFAELQTNAKNTREALNVAGITSLETFLQKTYGTANRPNINLRLMREISDLMHSGELFVVPTAEALRIFPQKAYHVTGSQALNTITNGKPLIPPMLHSSYDTMTHRGVGLQVMKEFLMMMLGMQATGGKDNFCYLGSQIDAEQIRIEHHIAKMGNDQIIQNFSDVFFENGRPHPLLRKVFDTLMNGQKPVDDNELVAYINKLMTTFNQLTGIREGWHEKIKQTLLGNQNQQFDAEFARIWSGVIQHILRNDLKVVTKDETPGFVAILEVDVEQALEKTAVADYNLIMPSGRNLKQIIHTTQIPASTIIAVYVPRKNISEAQRILGNTYEIKAIEDLPSDAYVGSIPPSQVGADTTEIVVRQRFGGTHPNWRNLIENGKLSLLKTWDFKPLMSPATIPFTHMNLLKKWIQADDISLGHFLYSELEYYYGNEASGVF